MPALCLTKWPLVEFTIFLLPWFISCSLCVWWLDDLSPALFFFSKCTAGYLFMTKADNKKYSATYSKSHHHGNNDQSFWVFPQKSFLGRMFIEIFVCTWLKVSTYLSGTGFISYLCMFVELSCSLLYLCPSPSASVLLHSLHSSLDPATHSPVLFSPCPAPGSGSLTASLLPHVS